MILSRENLKHVNNAKVLVPDSQQFELPEKVLQFGAGVLLRSLPDHFIDVANKQGIFNGRIVVVKSTSQGDLNNFMIQDSLYTLCIRGIEKGIPVEKNIISSSISRVIAAESNWADVLSFAKEPDLQIVISNTTEAGITLTKESIFKMPPTSFPAKLLAVLFTRYQSFKGNKDGKLVVIPTELIPDNGCRLKAIIIELALFNQLEPDVMEWINMNITFCNSLVDRIVPGKPDLEKLTAVETLLGYKDNLLSIAEPYSLWAVEGGSEIADVLAFEQVNAGMIVAENIEKYRELKVSILNGTHILTSGIALLAGIETVKQAMDDRLIQGFIQRLMQENIVPAIPHDIDEEEALNYAGVVLDRFANPAIKHLWKSITNDYTLKMHIRVLPVLKHYYKLYNTIPLYIAFGFAAYLTFMQNNPGVPAQLEKDNLLKGAGDADFFEGELQWLPGFQEAIIHWYLKIQQAGIKNALTEINQ